LHVQAMQRQVQRWAPVGTEFVCLSDVDVPGVSTIPLRYDWPRWWAKMEMFRPDIPGDFLFTDLDNVLLGPIDDFFPGKFTVNGEYGSGLMYVPESVRSIAWDTFSADPERYIQRHATARKNAQGVEQIGDDAFLGGCVGHLRSRWSDVAPGKIVLVTEAVKIPGTRFPPDARICICWGASQRPWVLWKFKHLRLYDAPAPVTRPPRAAAALLR
jgi:hypothetical protein